FERALDHGGRGGPSATDLDERDQVRRVERVAEDDTFGVPGTGILEFADRDRGRAGREDGVRGGGCIEAPEQGALELELLRAALLYELRLGHGRLRRVRESEPVRGGAVGQAECLDRFPL